MKDPKVYRKWIKAIVATIPCQTDAEVTSFIQSLSEAKTHTPQPEIVVDDHWFCARRYHDPVSQENLLEIYIGSQKSANEWMGYDRIDPRWLDAEGRDLDRWELTRAYMRPKYRGLNYAPFMVELVLALCKKNRGYSVVAYPRHVAMLVTLIKMGFRTMEGNYDATLKRILAQGLRWYRNDTSQRRLYYAQEFRPFIIEGSFIMEKRVAPVTLWEFLWQKI